MIITAMTFCLLIMVGQIDAQITTPAPSPGATISQAVGLTDFEVVYSRPSKKGRDIFGALVPYGEVWRTGANAATKFSASDDFTVEGKELKKGDYALFTKPMAGSWEVHFFPYTTSSSGGYGDATAAAVVTVVPMKTANVTETFQIDFINLKDDGATLCLAWDQTAVPVKIGVGSHAAALKSIERTLAGPSNGDYYNAGTYMARTKTDMDKALMYIRKATESDDPKFWQIKQESEILAGMGKHAEAIKKAQQSLELAKKAQNANYIRMNSENIAKWSKM